MLLLCFALSVCNNNADETGAVNADDLNLTQKIPLPVAGKNPVTHWDADNSQYSLEITWKDEEGTALGAAGVFEGREIYTAFAKVSVKPGYTLKGLAANSFRYTGSLSCTFNSLASTVTIVFPDTDDPLIVNDFNLTNKITKAARGMVPVSSYYGPQYWLNISWKETVSAAPFGGDDVFQPSTEYTAIAVITDTGYIWPDDSTIVFTHNDATSVFYDPPEKTITLNFPATADLQDDTARYTLEINLTANNGQLWNISGSQMDLYKQARYMVFECTASGNDFYINAVDLSLSSGITGWSEQYSQFVSLTDLSAKEDETLYYVIDIAALLRADTIQNLTALDFYFLWTARTYFKAMSHVYLVNSGDLNIPDNKWDIKKTGNNDNAFTGAPANTIIGFITRTMNLIPKE